MNSGNSKTKGIASRLSLCIYRDFITLETVFSTIFTNEEKINTVVNKSSSTLERQEE